jgi:hypothetical protein
MATQVTLNSGSVDSAGSLALKTNGTTTAVTINSSQGVEFNAGTAALPSITTTGDTNTGIFFPAADTIAFAEGGAEAMRIDSSGNVGIGGTPSATGGQLQVTGAGNRASARFTGNANGMSVLNQSGLTVYGNLSAGSVDTTLVAGNTASTYMAFGIHNGTSYSERMRIDSSGNLLVGTTIAGGKTSIGGVGTGQAGTYIETPASYTAFSIWSNSVTAAGTGWNHFYGTSSSNSVVNVQIRGNGNIVNANNSYGAISDAKMKENVVDVTPKLEKLNQVRVVNFNLIGENQKQIGVIAQELEQIFPSMVEESNDYDLEGNDLGTTTKSVKYSVFVPMLIKAIQEQQALIQSLTTRITALEAK